MKVILFGATGMVGKAVLRQCLYVSGMGTGGKAMWARVKGRTENELLALFPAAIMIRLGALRPMHAERSKAPGGAVLLTILAPLWPILQWLLPNPSSPPKNSAAQ